MVNEKGTIYYGTSIEHIKELDKKGLDKPRERNEQYISVSISGYTSAVEIMHEDLEGMGRVFSDEMKICSIRDNKIHYKIGYINSLTHIQGFGPNRSKYLFSLYGPVENKRSEDTLVAVIGKECSDQLVEPDKENEFEYMSLALHGFVKIIEPDHIKGWIVSRKHYPYIHNMMLNGQLCKRKIWIDDEFEEITFDEDKFYKYSVYPKDIEMYAKNISKKGYYQAIKIKHLDHILRDIYPIKKIPINDLEEALNLWYKENKEKIFWDDLLYQYRFKGNQNITLKV